MTAARTTCLPSPPPYLKNIVCIGPDPYKTLTFLSRRGDWIDSLTRCHLYASLQADLGLHMNHPPGPSAAF